MKGGGVAESTKAIGKLGEIEHEMRFHNSFKEMEEKQQCSENGLERIIAEISPEANLVVESKGELAARSSKTWYYGTSTDKPNIKINLVKEQALHRYQEGNASKWKRIRRTSTPKWHKHVGMKTGRSRH